MVVGGGGGGCLDFSRPVIPTCHHPFEGDALLCFAIDDGSGSNWRRQHNGRWIGCWGGGQHGGDWLCGRYSIAQLHPLCRPRSNLFEGIFFYRLLSFCHGIPVVLECNFGTCTTQQPWHNSLIRVSGRYIHTRPDVMPLVTFLADYGVSCMLEQHQ
jgi:hypothetical protein